jgi:endonuclease-8
MYEMKNHIEGMPEGPEVTFLSQSLHSAFSGKVLNDIRILQGRYVRHGAPQHFDAFKQALPLRLESVTKKGKVLFFSFEKDWTLISKLGLAGWWYIVEGGEAPSQGNVVCLFENGRKVLLYKDSMSYGTIACHPASATVEKEIGKLAPDVIEDTTTLAVFLEGVDNLRKGRANPRLEDVLMDQGALVSGVGNYLKSECLYDARLSPLRNVKDVTREEWVKLFASLRQVTRKIMHALIQKADTNAEGDGHEYEQGFAVYRRKEDPHGRVVRMHKASSGRTTYWVPEIQV